MLSHFSLVQLCVTPWTAAYQAPLSLGFSRQEHWSGLPFPSPMHPEARRGSQGASRAVPGKSGLPARGEGECVMALKSESWDFLTIQCPVLVLLKKIYVYNGHACACSQSCLTLCNPIDGSPPGSTIPGILQARTLDPSRDSRARTRSPSPRAWRPDFPGAAREAP